MVLKKDNTEHPFTLQPVEKQTEKVNSKLEKHSESVDQCQANREAIGSQRELLTSAGPSRLPLISP